MNHNVKIVLLVLFLLMLCSAGILYCQLSDNKTGDTVLIIQNGSVIKTIDLSCAEDCEFTINAENGGLNTIRIENGEIRIIQADCPDQTCVNMGVLRSESSPIVCLPHQLLIRFDTAEENS